MQCPAMLLEGLPEERESVLNVRDRGLLRGEFQTTLGQEVFDHRLDGILQDAFRFACNDEVIRITVKVNGLTGRS